MTQRTCKACAHCKDNKPVAQFGNDKRARDGLMSFCKACTSIKNAAAHRKHIEKRKAAALARRKLNRASAAQAAADWRKANPERVKVMSAAYRKAHPEKVAAQLAKWRAENPAKLKAYSITRKGLERNASKFPFTGAQLAARMAYFGNRCWMCRGAFDHVDHVKPLSKRGSNMLSNLRPACRSCNLSKHDKWFGVSGMHRFVKA